MQDLANRVPDDGVHHTVDAHALPDGRVRIGDNTFSAKEFADMLRRDPNFDGTKPVRLLSCDAGTSGLARDLANELGTPVTAPTGLAWSDGNGRVFSSDMGPDGRPGWPPNGGWNTHHPDGTATPASNDGFHPTRDGKSPGEAPEDAEARGKRAPRDTDNTDVDSKPSTVPRPDADGNWPSNVDGVPLDPIPTPTTYSPGSSEFHERFVDYDRPDHPGYRDRVNVDPPEQIQRNKTPHDADGPFEVDPKTGRPILDDQGNPIPMDPSVPTALRGEQPLAASTAYQVDHVNGLRTTFFTDENGQVKWVEADAGNKPTDRASDTPGKHFNPDLGYPLVPGASYRVNHQWDFSVNEHGRTEAMTGSPSFPGSRDRFRDDNGEFSAQGRSGREGSLAHPEAKDGYAGGHLAANEMGGPGEYINMYSQMAASNSGNNNDGWNNQSSWRAQEEELAAYHNPEAGRTIEQYQVRIDERDSSGTATQATMRWREVIFDPETGAVQSEHVRERQFANVRERVNFQDDRGVRNGQS
ncbi:DNA/RNA non-specific endonuclease [Saccharopolyspora dendranthemae]|nr:DNA/RNA non-specific endonuclease [Saccharopolyspora dendranthemae]